MPRDQETGTSSLRLHEFLRDERAAILCEWERQERHLASARDLPGEELYNNVPDILDAIAEQAELAEGGSREVDLPREAPHLHADERWHLGFSLGELTREYGILRSVILQKLETRVGEMAAGELVLLNAALDQAILIGVATYVESAKKTLEDERERLRLTLSNIGDGVISTDAEGRIVYLNDAAEKVSGWTREQALGRPVSEVLVAYDEVTREALESLAGTAEQSGHVAQHPNEILLQRRNGYLLPTEMIAAPLLDASGSHLGVVITIRDTSRIRSLTSQLTHLAGHDPLTDLPNRTLLYDRLTQEIARAERQGHRLALLYLDLDLFKDVNDIHGHQAGDELLKQVAHRLRSCVRQTDTVSRLGGDEFAVLVADFEPPDFVGELGDKFVRHIQVPYLIDSQTIRMSLSVGISVFPDDGRDPGTLIKHADVAMYQAKARGRNNVQFFVPEMNRQAAERRRLESDLREAIAANQLMLHFQPQVGLESRQVIGVEALLRWHHPVLGLIPPSRFIPVAERSGDLMIAIGKWVLEQACRQARAWRDAGHPPLRMSVNLSLIQLRHERFLDYVADILRRYRITGEYLGLELTESIFMSEIVGAEDRIRELKKLGLRISIDDFGTGYSSLSYLKNLPVSEIKIDKSFIRDIGSDPGNAAIVQAVIRMGESLKLRVVAEGVEDQGTVDFLAANGCGCAQGFFFGRPVEPGAFEQLFLNAS